MSHDQAVTALRAAFRAAGDRVDGYCQLADILDFYLIEGGFYRTMRHCEQHAGSVEYVSNRTLQQLMREHGDYSGWGATQKGAALDALA